MSSCRGSRSSASGLKTLLSWILLVMCSSSIAGSDEIVRPEATFPGAPGGSGPYTTNNDDSCDITVQPAATLLLPYFEADIRRPYADAVSGSPLSLDDTSFTITNTSNLPQIVKVQTWTDRGAPLFSYNIYLGGYDVQRVSIREILTTGRLPDALSGGQVGERSESTNPNHFGSAALNCSAPTLVFDDERLRETRRALTEGDYYTSSGIGSSRATGISGDANADGTLSVADLFHVLNYAYGGGPAGQRIDSNDDGASSIADALALASYLFAGGPEPFGVAGRAVGYVTADVVADCGGATPLDESYFTTMLLYDNVLMGDYQLISADTVTGNSSLSDNMVHIRAIPEGGSAGSVAPTNLPYTFYDLYVPLASPGIDRRQPLPNTFAVRFLDEQSFGYETRVIVWREGLRASRTPSDAAINAVVPLVETVNFDESTNPTTATCEISPCSSTPVSAALSVTDYSIFPPSFSSDIGGWLYLNLNNGGPETSATARTSSQNWVFTQVILEGRAATDFAAIPLGNGCSPDPGLVDPFTNPISPAENLNP